MFIKSTRGKGIFGEGINQKRARDVLPILVQRVQDQQTIKFSELTETLELQGNFYNLLMGDVCRHISTTLAELEQREN
ncbi:hypothetical protein C6497_17235 [Candidatus Poribacteria bacterium]|nr:MAG: hypothetical protein C6497_17235 [Candidatus Poribacteria bacterium]